jgi:hypothetical protein
MFYSLAALVIIHYLHHCLKANLPSTTKSILTIDKMEGSKFPQVHTQ